MTIYKISLYDGKFSKCIKTVDTDENTVREEVDKLNKDYPLEFRIRGYGYYFEKQREVR